MSRATTLNTMNSNIAVSPRPKRKQTADEATDAALLAAIERGDFDEAEAQAMEDYRQGKTMSAEEFLRKSAQLRKVNSNH